MKKTLPGEVVYPTVLSFHCFCHLLCTNGCTLRQIFHIYSPVCPTTIFLSDIFTVVAVVVLILPGYPVTTR